MDSQFVKLLSKLQAFIDQAFGIAPGLSCAAPAADIRACLSAHAPVCTTTGDAHLIDHFLRMAIGNTREYRAIAAALRKTEAYSMVSFLLQEGQGEKLETLSARYGISSGHFRRLFRGALGRSPKSDLNDWRLARAVLAVIERRQSVTEVAMEHGYASPSHFSNEVKKSLGHSLTHLFDAQKKQ